MSDPSVSGQQKIGSYLIKRQLGRGGLGCVWVAHDPDLDRDVAIKEILLPKSGSGNAVQKSLGNDRFTAAWQSGEQLSIVNAAKLALDAAHE